MSDEPTRPDHANPADEKVEDLATNPIDPAAAEQVKGGIYIAPSDTPKTTDGFQKWIE